MNDDVITFIHGVVVGALLTWLLGIIISNVHMAATNPPILYTTYGCHYCEQAKKDLKENCVIYKEIKGGNLPINVRPVVEHNKQYYVGGDQIESFAKTNNQCKK